MPETAGSTTVDVGNASNNQLASLIPVFDPATDSVEQWTQKIELLTQVWPAGRLGELATRIILNCKGGTVECISKIVELVGGQFGRVNLERKFDVVEKALFRCNQKVDESSDSYLARAEVVWSELLMKKVNMTEVQAYITLRGSRLSMEDKKRVLVEAGAEREDSELEMKECRQPSGCLVQVFSKNTLQENATRTFAPTTTWPLELLKNMKNQVKMLLGSTMIPWMMKL